MWLLVGYKYLLIYDTRTVYLDDFLSCSDSCIMVLGETVVSCTVQAELFAHRESYKLTVFSDKVEFILLL